MTDNQIEITLDTPNGPIVEYGADDDAEDVEAAVPPGWRVDWATPAYRLASGRYRAPLVEESGSTEQPISRAYVVRLQDPHQPARLCRYESRRDALEALPKLAEGVLPGGTATAAEEITYADGAVEWYEIEIRTVRQ